MHDLIAGGSRVVALFTSPTWCIPCQRFEPHWEKAIAWAETEKYPALFVKVDMGVSPEATGEHWASKDFNILGVPTVLHFTDEDNWSRIESRAIVPLKKELEGLG